MLWLDAVRQADCRECQGNLQAVSKEDIFMPSKLAVLLVDLQAGKVRLTIDSGQLVVFRGFDRLLGTRVDRAQDLTDGLTNLALTNQTTDGGLTVRVSSGFMLNGSVPRMLALVHLQTKCLM